MGYRFELTSVLSSDYLEDVEAIMFFNPRQPHDRPGIVKSLGRYGAPRITVEADAVRITVGQLMDVQTLFALADVGDGHELAGIVVFVRTDLENVLVLHIAVAERFSSTGPDAECMLAVRLLEGVRSVAGRLRGVRSITVMYSSGAPLRLAVRARARPQSPEQLP
jgi:uncharacterized protein YunC (DUF1805 family)